jgi:hypothetical protein
MSDRVLLLWALPAATAHMQSEELPVKSHHRSAEARTLLMVARASAIRRWGEWKWARATSAKQQQITVGFSETRPRFAALDHQDDQLSFGIFYHQTDQIFPRGFGLWSGRICTWAVMGPVEKCFLGFFWYHCL